MMMMMMMDDEIASQGSSGSEETPQQEPQPMTIPIHHHSSTTGWVDHAVLGIATACNLCDVYVHEQVRFEWDTQEKDLQAPYYDDDLKKLEIDLYKKFLFDESSIRLDDDFLDDAPSPLLPVADAATTALPQSTRLLLDTSSQSHPPAVELF
jgi:hypothetical protein